MELEHYFEISEQIVKFKNDNSDSISKDISFFEPELLKNIQQFSIALFGINDERNSDNKGTSQASDLVRKYFYSLYNHNDLVKILELGNLKSGHTIDDTYHAVNDIVAFLIENNIVPILFGSSQDIAYPIIKSLQNVVIKNLSVAFIDSRLDVGSSEELHNKSIIAFLEKNIAPYKTSIIGTQNYLIPKKEFDYFENTKLNYYRLGKIREDIKKAEPFLRDAHFTSMDIGAIRQCDAPGNKYSSPNGITGEEACQLAKYSGLSEKTLAFQLSEYNPTIDINEQTANLCAQIIWHFIDGFYSRKNDYPAESIEQLQKYIINSDELEINFLFYKSPKTDRWWIEIEDLESKILVPCNYDDYLFTCDNGIPDIYFQEKNRIKYLQTK